MQAQDAAEPIDAAYVNWVEFYEVALEKAEQQDETIFIYFWTDWCGPCKLMDEKVFDNPDLGPLVDECINLKLNAEEGTGAELKKRYGVNAHPMFLFVDADGKEIGRFFGSRTEDGFLTALESRGRNDPEGEWMRKAMEQQESEPLGQSGTQLIRVISLPE